jgi:hypothetical protein
MADPWIYRSIRGTPTACNMPTSFFYQVGKLNTYEAVPKYKQSLSLSITISCKIDIGIRNEQCSERFWNQSRFHASSNVLYIEIVVLVPCMIPCRFQYLKIDIDTSSNRVYRFQVSSNRGLTERTTMKVQGAYSQWSMHPTLWRELPLQYKLDAGR